MRLLVTGGAGYIGGIVAEDLLAAGHQVTVLDSLVRGRREAVPAAAHFVQADVGDGAALAALFGSSRFDAVLHFAAFIEAGEAVAKPEMYLQNNAAKTAVLLSMMLAHGVRRLVFSSTAAVYGDCGSAPVTEDAPLAPTNPYGESKAFVERALESLHREQGLCYASLRYFNAAGAAGGRGEQHQPESHLIPRVLDVALGRAPDIAIFGADYATPDGTCIRDYVHVADLAAAHRLALAALESRRRLVCNVGIGRGYSVREVIETARRVTGHAIPARDTPRRAGDPAVLVAAAERARREMGWRPQRSSPTAILGSAWHWLQAHPRGYGEGGA